MRKALALLLALPALAGAGELELTAYGGRTFPFYSQTFKYDPGPVTVPIPGVTVEQGGSFELKASGGAAFAGGMTFYVTGGFGFEVRYDHADITIDTQSSAYNVRVGLPAPLDPVVASLTLTEGTADLNAAAPLSLNLKLRTGGRVRLTASGGASRLGDLSSPCSRRSASGVIAVDLEQNHIQIGTIGLQATGVAGAGSSWGGNLGLGLQIRSASTPRSCSRARLLLPSAPWMAAGSRPAAHRDREGAARPRCRSGCRPSSSSRGGCRPRRVSRSASERPASAEGARRAARVSPDGEAVGGAPLDGGAPRQDSGRDRARGPERRRHDTADVSSSGSARRRS